MDIYGIVIRMAIEKYGYSKLWFWKVMIMANLRKTDFTW